MLAGPSQSTKTTVDKVTKAVKRFRILCVGRAGVGKSSIINHVFRIKSASVSNYEVGEADINTEFTSDENKYLLMHDSKGFEPGDTETFDIVSKFIKERRKEGLSLEDQLHAVWLCTETPRAGGRVFETGDEKLLKLACDTRTPIVLVFTKYDRLVRTKKAELKEDNEDMPLQELMRRSNEEAEKALDSYVNSKSVKAAMEGINHARVSTQPGYGADVSNLVDFTGDVVYTNFTGTDAWLIMAIAQRANFQLKIDAWLTSASMTYHAPDPANYAPNPADCTIRFFLATAHQDIITFWNFIDEENILKSEEFKRFILLLVQDAETSYDLDRPPPETIPQITQEFSEIVNSRTATNPPMPRAGAFAAKDSFMTLLSNHISVNEARTQRLLMTYTAGLTEVLRSLLDVIVESEPPERTSWSALKKAYERYERKVDRKWLQDHIRKWFKQDRRPLNPREFRSAFDELLKASGRSKPLGVPAAPSS